MYIHVAIVATSPNCSASIIILFICINYMIIKTHYVHITYKHM